MVLGRPCNLKIYSKYNWAIEAAVKGFVKEIKWVYWLSRFTTTKMVSLPLNLGSPSIKSREMPTQTTSGMGNDCRRPADVLR